jgi:hypothetical protein
MPSFRVTFRGCIQDSEEYGSNEDYMVSRVFFTLAVDGEVVGNFSADLKQVVGGDLERGDIDVSAPSGYDGPFDAQKFSDAVRDYFHGLVRHHRREIHIAGVGYVRMHNNRFDVERVFEFDSHND